MTPWWISSTLTVFDEVENQAHGLQWVEFILTNAAPTLTLTPAAWFTWDAITLGNHLPASSSTWIEYTVNVVAWGSIVGTRIVFVRGWQTKSINFAKDSVVGSIIASVQARAVTLSAVAGVRTATVIPVGTAATVQGYVDFLDY